MNTFTRLMKIVTSPVLKYCFQLEVHGLEHVKSLDGKYILAGNHTGLLDGPMILSAIDRPFHFIVKEEVLGWGLIGKAIPYLNTIILSKTTLRSNLSTIVDCLNNDGVICIFPEGELTQTGLMNDFKKGVGYLHQKTNAPVVPFYISGGFKAWPEGNRLPRFTKLTLTFGKPLTNFEQLASDKLAETLQHQVSSLNMNEQTITTSIIQIEPRSGLKGA